MLKKQGRRQKSLGKLAFFVPVVVIALVVVVGIIYSATTQTGTLIVVAYSSGRYSPQVALHPKVEVGAQTSTAPFNLTLPDGTYSVTYEPISWYTTPNSRTVTIVGGRTAYAVGVYSPVVRVISIGSNGFNSTSVTALHGVTPVVWVNDNSTFAVVDISSVGRIILEPSQNYTMIFPSAGAYLYEILNTGFSGTVTST